MWIDRHGSKIAIGGGFLKVVVTLEDLQAETTRILLYFLGVDWRAAFSTAPQPKSKPKYTEVFNSIFTTYYNFLVDRKVKNKNSPLQLLGPCMPQGVAKKQEENSASAKPNSKGKLPPVSPLCSFPIPIGKYEFLLNL